MNAVLESLALTLLHFGWQAVLIAAVYWLIDKVTARLKPGSRYLLSLAALIAMMVCAAGTFTYEMLRLSPINASISVTTMLPVASPTEPITLTLHRVMPWLDAAWLLGVLVLSLRTAGGLWFIQNLKKQSQPVSDSVQNRFTWLARRFGLDTKVTIRLHPAISGPFVVGIVKSVVYLPVSAATALSPEQLDAVLSHELEHIRRADFLWNLIQTVVETLFFYHPAVWWISARLREQRELCCDDAAISACTDPLVYATALLSLEEQRRGIPGLAMALNGQDGGLFNRIARMLGEKPSIGKVRRNGALLALPVLALALTAFAPPVAQVAARIAPEVQAQTMSQIDTIVANTPLAPAYEKVRVHAANFDRKVTTEGGVTRITYTHTDRTIEDEAEAAANKARAAAERAKQALRDSQLTQVDATSAAENARKNAEKARDNLLRQGYSADEIDIDPEAIAEDVRASIEEAKAEAADAAADSIDPDAIAEAVRQAHLDAARSAAADYEKYGQKYAQSYSRSSRDFVKAPKAPNPPKPPKPVKPCHCDVEDAAPPAYPETPAPLMDAPAAPAVPAAPATPATYSWKITAPDRKTTHFTVKPMATNKIIRIEPKEKTAAEVAMLGHLPMAASSPLPAPNAKTDVVVLVR